MSSVFEVLGLLIKRAQHRHHRALDAKLAPLGVSVVQWNALREINRNPGVSMHRLAELTFNSDQAFGTLTTRLLKQGLIVRKSGVGRVTLHVLSAKGRTLLEQADKLVHEVLVVSFAGLSESECGTLTRLLSKMLDTRRAT